MPGAKKGKRSVIWYEDTDILARLAIVSSMQVQGASPLQIAEALGVTLRTAYRDIRRCDELRKREYIDDVITNRNRSIAQFREIQMRAWEEYRANKKNIQALRLAAEMEDRVVELQGTRKPIAVDMTTKGESLHRPPREMTDDELMRIASGG
jgi:transposase